jgi:DNA polymerase I
MSRLYLIDGSGYVYRAYYGAPALLRPDGAPIGAVLGYCNMLAKLLHETSADYLAVVFDRARTSFRHRIHAAYKANRPPPPADLVPQLRLAREATEAWGVRAIERDDYEADDLIAAYARHAAAEGVEAVIVSSDKDLMQVVGTGISMLDPIKQRLIGDAEVREKFGVGPDKVVDVQALCGDSVDNVPGVPGIGVKTAAELINAYGDLETLLARAGEIKQPKRRQALIDFADQARLSRRLVLLDDRVPLPVPLEALEVRAPDRGRLFAFLRAQGFKDLLRRMEERLGRESTRAVAPVPPPEAWKVERAARVMHKPEPGMWALRLAKGGVEVAARIFWIDHEPGLPENLLDQPFLDAEINGERVHPDRVWHSKIRAIDRAEYDFLVADRKWAKEHAPHDPAANPYQPVDPMTVKPPF